MDVVGPGQSLCYQTSVWSLQGMDPYWGLGFVTDYAKAFDCMDHNKLWKILKEIEISEHLTCLLRNLYAGQEATDRLDMEQQTDSKSGNECIKAVYCHPVI